MQHKATRIFLVTIAALLVFILILQILVSLFGDKYVGEKIKQSIHESSQERYSLLYDDLDIGLINRSVKFKNLRLRARDDTTTQADSALQKNKITGNATEVKVAGISLWSYFVNHTLNIGSVTLEQPNVVLMPGTPHIKQQVQKEPSFSSVDSSLFALISQRFKAFKLHHFSVKKGTALIYKKGAPEDSSKWLEGINLTLNNIFIDSSSAQSGRYFITDNLHFNIKEYGQHISNNFYTLRAHNILFSSSGHNLSIDSLQFLPRYPKYEFSRRKGMEIDRFTLTVPHIELNHIDVDQSINRKLLYAQSAKIQNPRLQVFHDKSMPSPPPHDKAPLPQAVFKKLETKIKLDTLAITNAYISYSEQKADLNQPGTISFENIDGTFSGISNYEEDLNNEHILKLETTSKVMGEGLLKATFSFPMGHNNGQHSIKGSLGPMKTTSFNRASEYIAMVRFTSGMIYGMNFSMNVNKYGAQGNLTLDYENFKLEMLKKAGQQIKGKKRFKSFLANTFVIRDNNHTPPLGKAKIKFERKEQKSIFNLWWKALMSGLKEQVNIF